jgi:hypothetical protein
VIDLFEAELRDALRSKADSIPDEVRERLHSSNHHPRTIRWSSRVTYGTVAGAAATAATVVSVLVLGSASPAFAGWSATPTAPAGGQVAQAEAQCQAQLASLPPGGPTASDPSRALVLTDIRGPYTVAIYASSTSSSTCFTGPSFTAVSGTQGAITPAAAGKIQFSSSHLATRAGSPYTLVDGNTGPDVTGVSLVLDNSQHVQATLSDGWFEAWWPGSASATSAAVTTASGTTTQALNPVPSSCTPTAQTPCSGSGSGSGSSSNSGSGPGPSTHYGSVSDSGGSPAAPAGSQ